MTETSASPPGSTPPPGSPPPPGSGRPPLRRDPEAGYIGGVAAGLASHLDIDVVVIRIGFVIVTILTQGLGALAYLFGWVFIPQGSADGIAPDSGVPTSASTSDDRRGASFWFGVVLLTLGSLWFLGSVMSPGGVFGWLDGGVVMPLALLGLGVALWRQNATSAAAAGTHRMAPPPQSSPPPAGGLPVTPTNPEYETMPTHTDQMAPPFTGPTPPAGQAPPPGGGTPSWRPPADVAGPPPGRPPRPPGGSDSSGGAGWTPPPAPTRERSLLVRATLGIALLTAGILWILELADVTVLGPLRIISIVLGVLGIGLIVGSVAGRGRSLIVAGFVVLPLVVVGSLLRGFPAMDVVVGSGGTFGQISERPATVDEIDSTYQFGAGEFRVDLTEVDFSAGDDVTTSIEMGAGELVVILPEELDVEVDATVGAGELEVLDRRRSGLAVNLETTDRFSSPDRPDADAPARDQPPMLTIDLNVGFGDVTIERNDR